VEALSGDADLYDIGGRYGKMLGLADFDDAFDRLLDVLKRLFARFSLRHTPWNPWNTRSIRGVLNFGVLLWQETIANEG
jgi:hypothetical protein